LDEVASSVAGLLEIASCSDLGDAACGSIDSELWHVVAKMERSTVEKRTILDAIWILLGKKEDG
jgi:hypothetical protein